MNAKDRFELFRVIAFAARCAAERTGCGREYEALRDCIEKNERDHRRFGRSLVGPSATRGRFSVDKAVDLFVVKTLADAYGKSGYGWERQISALVGVRDDYVRAAILVARAEFREAFQAELGRAVREGRSQLAYSCAFAFMGHAGELADYSTLANGEVK